jgi:hypothetical protein|tara:strand:+ start:649 stop:843 length:195 start_codon:yes stop_codon:yes gene_type:complete
MTEYDGWTVVLHEMMMHVQKFVDDNPMEYKGKELKAYTTGLGMVSVLAKQMIRDIQREKADVEV